MIKYISRVLPWGIILVLLIGCGDRGDNSSSLELSDKVIGSFQDCYNCPEMVVIEGGEFLMGDREGYKYSKPYHLPMHKVNIGYNIAVSKFEITNRQYNECYASGACSGHILMATIEQNPELLDVPIERATWPMAQEYTVWLSQKTGRNYRLLSESEWEYIARADTDTEYWWGDEMLPGYALCGNCDWNPGGNPLIKVGDLPMNPFGVYGLNGSVQEWVQDCMNNELSGRPVNGEPRVRDADCSYRVKKGSGYMGGKGQATSSSRAFAGASTRQPIVGTGIRLATLDIELR